MADTFGIGALTTSVETVPASGTMPASSTVNGTLTNGVANGQTFQTGDVINANSTSDVNVNLLVDQANLVAINNARSVNFRNLSNGNTTAANTNAILWQNVGTFSSTNSLAGQVGVGNGALATTYALVTPLIDSGAGINVTYRAADITGATDTANFSVSGVGSTSDALVPAPSQLTINGNSTGATNNGVEIATVATTGTNNFNINFGTNVGRLNISGAGNNTIQIQAGGITATAQNYSLSGATGTNTLDVAATLATSSTVTGGTGSDTLRVTPSGLAITNLTVSGIETLRLRNAAVAGTMGFLGTPSFSTIRVDSSTAGVGGAVALTLLNSLQSTQAINYRGSGATATAANTQTFNQITATGATTGAADTINISYSNGGVPLTNVATYTSGVLIANGVENFNLSVADGTTTSGTAAQITSNTLNSFVATGNGALTLTLNGDNATSLGGLATVNLSALVGDNATRSIVTVGAANNSLAGASSVTASASGTGLIITGAETATDVLTFTGGAGVDVIGLNGIAGGGASAFTGFVNFNGGAGNDEINLAVSAGVVANGGDGNDNLFGSAAIDTLRGDAGTDAITGRASNDILTGGDGADTFTYVRTNALAAGATAANILANNGLDNITDFAAADILGVVALLFAADGTTAAVEAFANKTAAAAAAAANVIVISDDATAAIAAAGSVDAFIATQSTATGTGVIVFNQGGVTQLWYDRDMDTANANDTAQIGTLSGTALATLATLGAGNFA